MLHCVCFHSAVTLNDLDVRDAQKAAYYYRSLCKRPIRIVITKQDDGYYCRRVA
jgi:hypothetical protein